MYCRRVPGTVFFVVEGLISARNGSRFMSSKTVSLRQLY